MYGNPAMTCFKYQVYLYEAIFCICTLSNLLSRTRKTEVKFLIVFNSNATVHVFLRR
jgi:hypothetical protein